MMSGNEVSSTVKTENREWNGRQGDRMNTMTLAAQLGLRGAQAAVLDHIEARGGRLHQTLEGIERDIGFSKGSISQALQRLRGQRLVWIEGFRQIRGMGRAVAVYRLNVPVIEVLLDKETGRLGRDLAEAYADEGRT